MKLHEHPASHRQLLMVLIAFLSFLIHINAQEEMVVTRCLAVKVRLPIINLYVDEAKNKWASTGTEFFKIQAIDFASKMSTPVGNQVLFNFPDGNSELEWAAADLAGIIGEGSAISAAFYDKKKEELWIGTRDKGVFQLKMKPTLQLLNNYSNRNSKLKSNEINAILIDQSGEAWIASAEGILIGKDSRWNLAEKLFSFQRVLEYGSDTWILGDGLIWKVNSKGSWIPVEVDSDKIEGDIKDIALDLQGRLWIASEIITCFNPETFEYQTFGPIEYYTSQYATRIVVDQDNAVWIGTEDKGVYLIEKASAMTVNCLVEKELSCDTDKNDAALRVKVTGGEAPYQFAWSNGLNTDNPKNLGAGEYSVTVTDSKGKSKSAQIAITNPRFTVELKQIKEESAEATADGSASVTIGGLASDFTFKWDNGETTQLAKQLKAGSHSVTVTDKKGCSAIGNVTITKQLAALTINLNQTSQIKCAGGKDAALQVQVSGGKAPFQFQWNDAKIMGDKPAGLSAGNYQVTVTDAAGNQSNATISIQAPETINLNLQVQSPASTGNADGKALAQAKGGAGDYSFQWDNGETNPTATKLAPGKHSVTVTDANGCTASASVDITENILPLAINLNQTSQIKCAGGKDAALQVQVSGGKAPFQFQWNDAKIMGDKPAGLSVGEYIVTVTDITGGVAKASISIIQPTALSIEIKSKRGATTEKTKDGKATAEVKGGTAPYTFQWDNGESVAAAKELPIGMHSVTVTDANGCFISTTVETTKRILPDLTVDMLKSGSAIRMEQLQFDADSININEPSMPVLNELYEFLEDNPTIVVEIGGHTNNLPPDEYCDRISTERAKAVANYLIGKGINPKRLYSKGYGKRVPITSNDTPEGRRRNQRVEIKILQLDEDDGD